MNVVAIAVRAMGPLPAWAETRGVPAVHVGRPAVTHGVMAGDVTADSAVIWARADQPSRMLIELLKAAVAAGSLQVTET